MALGAAMIQRVFTLLATILATTAFAEDAVPLVEAEKILQARKPFSAATLSAESSEMVSVGVGDIVARRNPMHPDFMNTYTPHGPYLSDGSTAMTDVAVKDIPAAIASLEQMYNSTHVAGGYYYSLGAATNSIKLYMFEWTNDRVIQRRVKAPMEKLATQDLRCLREAAAAAYSAARAEPEILAHLRLEKLHLNYISTDDADLKPQLQTEGKALVFSFVNKKEQCSALSANQLRQELKRLYHEKFSSSEREVHALQKALDQLEIPEGKSLVGGRVIESRVAQKTDSSMTQGAVVAQPSAHAL
jgi:hypothetical protein